MAAARRVHTWGLNWQPLLIVLGIVLLALLGTVIHAPSKNTPLDTVPPTISSSVGIGSLNATPPLINSSVGLSSQG